MSTLKNNMSVGMFVMAGWMLDEKIKNCETIGRRVASHICLSTRIKNYKTSTAHLNDVILG